MTGGEISLSYKLWQSINIEYTIKLIFINNRMKAHDATITSVVMDQIKYLILFFIIGSMISIIIPTRIV